MTMAEKQRLVIHEKQILGVGSFGKVCKALYDGVPCAAKILHQTLFDPTEQHKISQNGAQFSPFERFKQESKLLNEIRHPNVIQFLALCEDPSTGLPVILMELMDTNLTNFLVKKDPLPYHIKVNICYDISLALSYLHSKSIIHRDLSSSNVLLDCQNHALPKAKVADFGMAKFYDLQAVCRTLTANPGKLVYMPPEALQDKPVYAEKIDCFSFGVIILQILTQCYPEPGPLREELNSEEFGLIERRIPEVQRRRDHISKIDQNDPLLLIALNCLKDKGEERPSAEQICKRVYEHNESVKSLQSDGERQPENYHKRNDHHFEDQNHGEKNQSQVVMQADAKNSSSTDLKLIWRYGTNAPYKIFGNYNATVDTNTVYMDDPSSSKVYAYSTNTSIWNQLPDRLTTACPSVIVNSILTTVGGRLKSGDITNKLFSLNGEGSGRRWIEILPPMMTNREYATSVCIGTTLTVAGGMTDDNLMLKKVEVMNTENRQWSTVSDLPQPLSASSPVVCGDYLYLFGGKINENGEENKHIYKCKIGDLQSRLLKRLSFKRLGRSIWDASQLPNLPLMSSTYVSLKGKIISIGGKDANNTPTAAVQAYNQTTKSWKIDIISNLSTPRSACFVAVLPNVNQLMVIGGRTENGEICTTVEIADID